MTGPYIKDDTIIINTLLEPRHEKPNKMSVRPAKTQISLVIRPVWSESSLCAQWVDKDQYVFIRTAKTLIGLGECPDWSESSLGAHSFCWFCHVAAHFVFRDAHGRSKSRERKTIWSGHSHVYRSLSSMFFFFINDCALILNFFSLDVTKVSNSVVYNCV